jgi:hypothetical protein
MNIYVDEAGAFTIPQNRRHLLCCVAGLMVPSGQQEDLFYRFLRLRDSWGNTSVEMKGRTLDETQFAAVAQLLNRYDVITEVCAIDMAAHTESGVTAFKERQADALTANLGDTHHPNLVKQMQTLQENLRKTSNQLFTQSFLLTHLLINILQTCTLYYCQRLPEELGSFSWTIDAKDKSVTKAEKIWSKLLFPFLESASFTKPLTRLKEGDYSHFGRYSVSESTASEGMKTHIKWLRGQKGVPAQAPPVSVENARLLFEELKFADSQDVLGLQLADIVVSGFYRALNGSLQKTGWKGLGSLLVEKAGGIITLAQFSVDREEVGKQIPVPRLISSVLGEIRQMARPMFLDDGA